jgi:multicomponent Na+:H+ antiporter subunit E
LNYFVSNLLLAFLWAAATATFSFANLVVGFALGYAFLVLGQPVLGRSRYFGKAFALVAFAVFFVKEVIRANLLLAYDVITPSHRLQAGVVAVPLRARTDLEITVLANLLSLTPGTLSLDVSDDRRVLYVHAMFRRDPDEVRRSIAEGLEARVLELLR